MEGGSRAFDHEQALKALDYFTSMSVFLPTEEAEKVKWAVKAVQRVIARNVLIENRCERIKRAFEAQSQLYGIDLFGKNDGKPAAWSIDALPPIPIEPPPPISPPRTEQQKTLW